MRSNQSWLFVALAVFLGLVAHSPAADDSQTANDRTFVESLGKENIPGFDRKAIGVTRQGTVLYAFVPPADGNDDDTKHRITLVGGIDGLAKSARETIDALRWFQHNDAANSFRAKFILSAVPCANPDGIAAGKGTKNLSGGDPSSGYPPRGPFYNSPTDPESAYVWRWLGMEAPDIVIEVHSDPHLDEGIPAKEDSLVVQLSKTPVGGMGKIPTLRLNTALRGAKDWLPETLSELLEPRMDFSPKAKPSEARLELEQRRQRSPLEVAYQLAKFYGRELGKVEYIPALALVGRLRLGELTNDPRHRADVERMVAPFVRGEKESTPTSGSGQAGHLIFSELAKVSEGKQRKSYIEMAQVAANQMFDSDGKMKPVMPFHNEMSDALFMGGPILASTNKLTGDVKYADGCVQHLRFMQKLVQRDDRLYRHSPLDETAWGRGNGFPALGLALVLSDFPAQHPARAELLALLRGQLEALKKYQDSSGSWHQVIDHEESYREFTCTCMIGFAMLRGMRNGWFAWTDFEPNVNLAWRAIQARIDDRGGLVDVCTGTGKQKSLRDYLDREAILGKDARGGAMALMFTTELAAWEKEKAAAEQ